ncbi:hypothetical protein JMN12_10475 [Capnocytophaga genosp. AHN8471]|uniref:hypothetical protein n=1 Tax=Capnocytophaga genosp. AHN8471 TaxID=327574 RepID=UPI001934871B|nr:hypothetical protein [Capnocytophaga genosp. AHN8471]MBM0656964.1 hypothetical protein [Capnocytophaga genosp. AHN8471]
MSSTTLFEMPFSEFQLKNAVSSALQQSLNYPTQFSIESNLEAAVKSYVQERLEGMEVIGQSTNPSPPNFGIKTGFYVALEITLNYKMKLDYRATAGAGIQCQFGNLATNHSAMFSFIRSSEGAGVSKYKNISIDVVLSSSIVLGKGEGMPMNNYTINYNLPEPIPNNFEISGAIGQAITYNSAINEVFSLNNLQRQGYYNVRINNISFSTNNDSRFYGGGNTDFGWTGGFIVSFLLLSGELIEGGYQNFTGRYNENGEPEEKLNQLEALKKDVKKDKTLNSKQRNLLKSEINQNIDDVLSEYIYHTQDSIQKSFNKAPTFIRISNINPRFRINNNNSRIQLDFELDGWGQNGLHGILKNLKFPYYRRAVLLNGNLIYERK